MKLFSSDLQIMDVLWDRGELSAKEIAQILSESAGWSKTTTYTMIQKCITKGAVIRRDPGYFCRAAVTREEIGSEQTDEVIDRLYGGAPDLLVASLLDRKKLTKEDIRRLRAMIDTYDSDR